MSSQFEFLKTETQFKAIFQEDPRKKYGQMSVTVLNSQDEELFQISGKVNHKGCCDFEVQYSATHPSLGNALKTETLEKGQWCGFCFCLNEVCIGVFAGQEHLGSFRQVFGCNPHAQLLDNKSNVVFDISRPKRSGKNAQQILFSSKVDGEEGATLDSQIEYISDGGFLSIVKDINYKATMTFPVDLSIPIKLCLLMRTAIRVNEIYEETNNRSSGGD
ncbi:Oidioi.mRNA.OKI2018_I69.chr2.g5171.t1.cds [Oikopleura dioica]|uniref:Oidioi.mRNA.OKI2018_I69.chr2.g5161.t1.cds n=1 Tax=Oikopleura dioica TaxID=34765 RepID=A0ABN7SZI2_OIKDI|nr:Oidioi.mRNA.OKI2018_I69.chr2.g5161.t1.cds [Oikopleura dioica]CAG5110812.1 Oidioi.mRNA.OKI2018_I69.chr2.g5171.t1.cds [Oikopleura dioica]